MPENRFPNGLQQFTVHAASWVGSFAQPVADAKVEFSVGNYMVQGTVIKLHINRMIGATGTHADQG